MKVKFRRVVLTLLILLALPGAHPARPLRAAASARPERIAVTIYNQDANSRGFNWITNNSVTSSQLEIIKQTNQVTINSVNWANATIVNGVSNNFYTTYRSWKAHLLNLEYRATYFYRILTLPSDNYSDIGQLYIDDGHDGLNFTHVTDPQSYSQVEYEKWTNTIDIINDNFDPVYAMLMAGDLTQQYKVPEDNINEWGYALNGPKHYFQNNLITPASGNHDKYDNMYSNHFNIALDNDQDTTTGAYYTYVVGDVQIIVLNTNDELSFSVPLARKQLAWLEDVLASSTSLWKIVMLHHGLITTGRHMLEADIESLRLDLMPLFSQYHVDLVLQGHDHVYARSYPYLWDNTGFVAYKQQPNNQVIINHHQYQFYDDIGTMYVIQNMATARAAALSSIADVSDFPTMFAIANSPSTNMFLNKQPKVPTFGYLSIKDGRLLYQTYMLERFKNLILYDYFGIKKNSVNYVINLIDNLPATYKIEDIFDLVKAANEFNKLTEEEKGQIASGLKSKLSNLLKSISLSDFNNAEQVNELIRNLENEPFDEQFLNKTNHIMTQYNQLSNIAKAYVKNYQLVTYYQEEYGFYLDAQPIISAIEQLVNSPSMTISQTEVVRTSYDLLNDRAKLHVTNYFSLATIEATQGVYLSQLGGN